MAWTIVWLAGLMLVLRPLAVRASPGDLDSTFGDAGHVTELTGGAPFGSGIAEALVLQSDGKLVAGGGPFEVARFETDGTLDSTFGSSGWATGSVGVSPFLIELALQPDGKIVAAGCVYVGGTRHIALARYDDGGALDGTFGTGGVVVGPALPDESCVGDLTLQSDGKLVVAYAEFDSADFNVIRYEDDGDIDTGFGTGGVATVTVGAGGRLGSVVVQPDGMIVVAGTIVGTDAVPVLVRIDTGGLPDPGFGSGGIATDLSPAYLTEVIVAPDGKLIAAASTGDGGLGPPPSPTSIGFIRFHDDGMVDLRASVDVADMFGAVGAIALRIVREPDGGLVIGGTVVISAIDSDAVLARFDSNGVLDAGFGCSGVVADTFSFNPTANALVLQADGKLVTAGGWETTPIGSLFVLARFIGATTEPSVCGNGSPETGEACDDGNTEGGDCCSSVCAFDPASTPCPDSTVCNGDETCDGAGECTPGTPPDCDDADPCTQDTCDTLIGCVNDDSPLAVCKAAEKSSLVIKSNDNDQRDTLIWKWRKGAETTLAELGNPADTADYTLCLYAGGSSFGAIDILADASRWTASGTTGFRYADPEGAADGARRGRLQSGPEGSAKVLLKAKGIALPDGLLPISDPPIAVQLVNSETNACFGSTFDAGDVLENSDAMLKARD